MRGSAATVLDRKTLPTLQVFKNWARLLDVLPVCVLDLPSCKSWGSERLCWWFEAKQFFL